MENIGFHNAADILKKISLLHKTKSPDNKKNLFWHQKHVYRYQSIKYKPYDTDLFLQLHDILYIYLACTGITLKYDLFSTQKLP